MAFAAFCNVVRKPTETVLSIPSSDQPLSSNSTVGSTEMQAPFTVGLPATILEFLTIRSRQLLGGVVRESGCLQSTRTLRQFGLADNIRRGRYFPFAQQRFQLSEDAKGRAEVGQIGAAYLHG